MDLSKINEFIDRTMIDNGKFYRDEDMDKRIFAQSIKLSEECGELASQILWNKWLVRKEKLSSYTEQTLKDEFADVILTTFRLAKLMWVDMSDAIKNKIEKIKNR